MEESKPKQPKHTPGPWSSYIREMTGVDGETRRKCFIEKGGVALAQFANFGDEDEANAMLCAAAPELLECLKDAVLEFGCHTHMLAITDGECNGFIREEWRCTLPEGKCFAQRWLDAIRKAEGLEHD